jgi:hypothetical protein
MYNYQCVCVCGGGGALEELEAVEEWLREATAEVGW